MGGAAVGIGVSVGAGRGVPDEGGVGEPEPDSADAARASDVARALMEYRSFAMELSSAAAVAVGVVRGAAAPAGTRLPGSEAAGLPAMVAAVVGALPGGRAGVTCWT